MASDWGERKLGDIAENISRPFDFSKFEDVIFVNTGDVFRGKFLHKNQSSISGLPGQAKKRIENGDILLTEIRPGNGRFAYVGFNADNYVVSTKFMVIRPLRLLLPRFLYLVLSSQSVLDEFQRIAESRSGTFPQITFDSISHYPIPAPPKSEQLRILSFIGAVDDKIELNRQMNQTLEAMARAIFKSWFVDFDPVRAKLALSGDRRSQVEGSNGEPYPLAAETLALFPARFVDSALGPIPEGWEVKEIPETFFINPRRKLKKGQVAPYLGMSDMPTSSARPQSWKYREFGSGMRFVNGDTLVARITPCLENGKTAFVDFLESGQVGWGSTEYIVFRSKPPLPLEFAYFMARTNKFRLYAIANMTGTSGRQRVPASSFDHYQIVVPTEQIAERFGEIAKNFMAMMKQNDEESSTLSELRGTLLPKLISGELRVPEVVEMVEEAGA